MIKSKIKFFILVLNLLSLLINSTFSQHLSSSRNIGIAAATSNAWDINSLDWNPACLISINDWRFDFTSFLTPNIANSGLSFHNFSIAKKILEKHTLAIRYSPGSVLEFIIPSTFTFFDADDNPMIANFDKKISYNQRYTLGYASEIFSELAIGVGTRFYEVKISDTKYSLDTNNIIKSLVYEYNSTQWSVDLGGIYKLTQNLNFGLVFKNLFIIRESELNENVKQYQLTLPKFLRLGLSYEFNKNFLFSLDLNTEKNFNLGGELPVIDFIKLRGGIYTKNFNKFDAMAIGAGLTYQNFQFDLSYLNFFNKTNRRGTSNIQSFFESDLLDLDYNIFAPDRVSISIGIKLGKIKGQYVKIEHVEIFGEIFPSAYYTYAFRPIGKVRVRNISSKPIEARISFLIKDFMDEPTETKPLRLLSGENAEVPIFAVFNKAIHLVKNFSIHEGNVYVYAEPNEDFDDRYQIPVIIRGRNDWNGDISQLKYFITPDDPDVLKFARNAIQKSNVNYSSYSMLAKFENAKTIFNELSNVVTYINDPNHSTDIVQYPAETLNLHAGDCEDITVCYSALLASVGIDVALIDVIPPDNPKNAHIYMMFDTELPVENAILISENSKKYIVRKNSEGKESIWIPVETTLISKGFIDAWNYGASEYFNNAIIKNGLIEGWIRILDLNSKY